MYGRMLLSWDIRIMRKQTLNFIFSIIKSHGCLTYIRGVSLCLFAQMNDFSLTECLHRFLAEINFFFLPPTASPDFSQ